MQPNRTDIFGKNHPEAVIRYKRFMYKFLGLTTSIGGDGGGGGAGAGVYVPHGDPKVQAAMSRLASSPTSAVVWNDPLFWRPKAVTGVFIREMCADIGRVVRGDITAAAFVAAHPPSNFRFAGASAAYDDQLDPLDFEGYVLYRVIVGGAGGQPTYDYNKIKHPFYAKFHAISLTKAFSKRLDESLSAKRSSSRGYWLGLPPAIGVHFPEVAKLRTFLTCYLQMMHEAAAASRRLFAELGVAEPSSLRPWAKDATIDETLLRRVTSLFESKFAEYNLQITGELRPKEMTFGRAALSNHLLLWQMHIVFRRVGWSDSRIRWATKTGRVPQDVLADAMRRMWLQLAQTLVAAPYAPSQEVAALYAMSRIADEDAAVDLAAKCPAKTYATQCVPRNARAAAYADSAPVRFCSSAVVPDCRLRHRAAQRMFKCPNTTAAAG